jgi:hypothetical protein
MECTAVPTWTDDTASARFVHHLARADAHACHDPERARRHMHRAEAHRLHFSGLEVATGLGAVLAGAYAFSQRKAAPKRIADSRCDEHLRTLQIPSSMTPTTKDIEKAYKARALHAHPDKKGGSHEEFVRIKNAYEEAKRCASGRTGFGAARSA